MSLRLSEILEHDAPHLDVTSRRRLIAFHDAMVAALRAAELTPEGGALPTTFNTLLALLPGDHQPLKRDRDVTDWSVENDTKYAAFLTSWREQTSATASIRKPRALAAPLHQAVTALQMLEQAGAKKSELEAAVRTFLDVYALSQHALRLPAIEQALPARLPAGIALDETKVTIGNDDKGNYVGLVKRTSKPG